MSDDAHGRLPWIRPEDLDLAGRAVYEAIAGGPRASDAAMSPFVALDGRLEGPFNAMLFSPTLGGAVQALGSAIRYGSVLSDRARELAILAVAAHHRSEFEWFAHLRLARGAGLDEEDLLRLAASEEPRLADDDDAALWRAVQSLLWQRDLDDEEYRALERAVGRRAAVELMILVGYYELLALLLRALRVPLPSGVERPFAGTGASLEEIDDLDRLDRKDVP